MSELGESHSHQSSRCSVVEVREMEDIQEYLLLLLSRENDLYPPCKEYMTALQGASFSSRLEPVNEKWRRTLCEWAYEVVDHFKFDREVVFIALDYLDRFVSKWAKDNESHLPKREYQLIAVTAIYMALKIHGEMDSIESPRRKLRIDAFFELSRKQFNVEIIEKTERLMLQALDWNINPPTALKFITVFLSLCPSWKSATSSPVTVIGALCDVARYLTELSVCQSDFSFTAKTSTTSYAAILCAMEATKATSPIPYQVRVAFLNNIAETTGLVAGDVEVLMLCARLKKLCPTMFGCIPTVISPPLSQQDESESHELEDMLMEGDVKTSRTSPVCVIEAQKNKSDSRRKRGRSDEYWRPISTSTNSP